MKSKIRAMGNTRKSIGVTRRDRLKNGDIKEHQLGVEPISAVVKKQQWFGHL